MEAASAGWLRLGRAWLAVALTLTLAAGGHAVGGGDVPAAALPLLAILLAPVALLATAVRWTFGRAVTALAAGQVLVHLLLTWMAPATGGYAVSPHLSHGPAPQLADVDLTAHAASGSMHLTAGMIWAHVLSTVATAVLIAYAENALWSVLVRLLPSVTLPTWSLVTPNVAMASPTPTRLHGIPVGAVAGRGPPAMLLPTCA